MLFVKLQKINLESLNLIFFHVSSQSDIDDKELASAYGKKNIKVDSIVFFFISLKLLAYSIVKGNFF